MHGTRVIVALFAVPLFYLSLTKLSPVFFLGLMIAATVLGLHEFYSMYRSPRALLIPALLCGALIVCSPFFVPRLQFLQQPHLNIHLTSFMLSFMIISGIRLFAVRNPEGSLKDLSSILIGLFYIPVLLLPQWYLRLKGADWILLLYGCVWGSDSAAYYAGKGFGKKKLYPEVSPNKTMEGAYGSIIGGAVSALVVSTVMDTRPDIWVLLVIGCSIGAATIVGDLVESMFKRDAGVKDSGSLFPGHGGILDKLDGALFAGPVLAFLSSLA